MRILERADDDLDPLVEVLRRAHSTGWPAAWPEAPHDWISPDGLLGAWVAVDGREVIGHVGVAVPAPGRMPEVTRLFVDPAHRGKGVADALLAAAEDGAPGTHVRLDVAEDAPGAWRLCERRGWCHTGSGPAGEETPTGDVPTVRYYAKRVG